MNIVSSYSSVYEIAEKYTAMSREVPYPIKGLTSKPIRDYFHSDHSFGVSLERWEAQREVFLQLRKEYYQTQERITQAFKCDLLEYLEVFDHPKVEHLWNLAWGYGHSSGYNDVASYAEDFSELMK